MKSTSLLSFILFCALLHAQGTTRDSITSWVTITSAPRQSQDTTHWILGKWLPVNDSISVQHRKSITGVIQRRMIYRKKDE